MVVGVVMLPDAGGIDGAAEEETLTPGDGIRDDDGDDDDGGAPDGQAPANSAPYFASTSGQSFCMQLVSAAVTPSTVQ